jgi:hypothetical protein
MLDCDRTLQHVNSTLQKIPKEKKFKKDTIILSITSAVRITEVITIISTLKKKQQYQSIWFFNIKPFFFLSLQKMSLINVLYMKNIAVLIYLNMTYDH